MRKIVVLWIACSLLVIGATACTQDNQANEITTTLPGAASDIPVADCPIPETDFQALYIHPEHGYCFLYPSFYTAEAPNLTVASVVGSIFDEVNDVPLTLTIQRLDRSDDLDLSMYAADDVGDLEYTLSEGEIAGYPTVFIDDLIASTSLYDTRSAYVSAGGWFYVLTVVPEDTNLPEASRQARILWDTVTSSIAFPE